MGLWNMERGERGKKYMKFEGTSGTKRPPTAWVLGNMGKGHLFQGNKGQSLRGTTTILGNREHKKTNFRFRGDRGTSQFISGEQGNM